jgi:hypothetical protein
MAGCGDVAILAQKKATAGLAWHRRGVDSLR